MIDVGYREVRQEHGLVVGTQQDSRKGALLVVLDGVVLNLDGGGDGVVDFRLGEGVAGREEGIAGHGEAALGLGKRFCSTRESVRRLTSIVEKIRMLG